jgi:glycosyltransferase involved in cell wall biosynthesis
MSVRGGHASVRVAFHVDQLWFEAPGGIGTYVEALFWELPRQGVDLVTFSSRWRRRTPMFAPLTTDGRFPAVELPVSIRLLYPAWDYLRRPSLPGELAQADIVHATNHAAIPPVRTHQRLVVTVHDLTFERFPELYPKRWLALYRKGLEVAAAEAAAILVPSEHVRDEVVAKGVEQDRLHVTPLASGMTEPDAATRLDRDDYGITPPYVLTVGTVEPRKNLPRLVRAYRRLAEEGFPHALVILGPEGWGSSGLRREIDRGGPGRIIRSELSYAELAAAYADADAVAYVSLYEGFGLPVLEAMSMGAAVVASNISAIPEVAGDAALLVDPTDEDAIAEGLRRVLEEPNLREDLSRRGRERAAAFSWEATARATLAVYREVLR